MAKLQEVFLRIQKSKKEKKEIKSIYRDALSNSAEHQKITEDIKVLKEKKKGIEGSIQDDMNSEFIKLDQIKIDIESDNMLLSDIAINHIVNGEIIELSDDKENKYEPIFSVKFKKT